MADLKFSNPRQANQRDAMLAKQRREREAGKKLRLAQEGKKWEKI